MVLRAGFSRGVTPLPISDTSPHRVGSAVIGGRDMRMRRLGSRFSLLAKFASVSLLAIVVLGLVVGRSFQMTIEE